MEKNAIIYFSINNLLLYDKKFKLLIKVNAYIFFGLIKSYYVHVFANIFMFIF